MRKETEKVGTTGPVVRSVIANRLNPRGHAGRMSLPNSPNPPVSRKPRDSLTTSPATVRLSSPQGRLRRSICGKRRQQVGTTACPCLLTQILNGDLRYLTYGMLGFSQNLTKNPFCYSLCHRASVRIILFVLIAAAPTLRDGKKTGNDPMRKSGGSAQPYLARRL
jgi:hypothetical protein